MTSVVDHYLEQRVFEAHERQVQCWIKMRDAMPGRPSKRDLLDHDHFDRLFYEAFDDLMSFRGVYGA